MRPSLAVLTLFLLAMPSSLSINEATNFDYKQHGADWSYVNCPTNGIVFFIQGPNSLPSSSPQTPLLNHLTTPIFSANSRLPK